MPGFTRRSKPLRGTVEATDISDFTIANPSEGQLLSYDATAGVWINTTALTSSYTVAGTLQVDTSTVDNNITVGGTANITGTLDVTGNAEFDGTLIAVGATTLSSTLSVTGAATLSSTLGLTGALTGAAGFSFGGAGTVDSLTVTNALVAGSLAVSSLTLADLTVTAGITGNTADFSGALTALSVGTTAGVTAASGSFSTSVSAPKMILSGGQGDLEHDTADVILTNNFTTGHVNIKGFQTGNTEVSLITADPDADVALYHIGVEVATTTTAAAGGLTVNNTLTGAGIERVLTVGDLTFGNDKVLYSNNSGVLTALALGAAGEVLTSAGATSAPTFENPNAGYGNHKVLYSNGSGVLTELALGASGEVLTSQGTTSAPQFAAAGGGGFTYAQDDVPNTRFEMLFGADVTAYTQSGGLRISDSTGDNPFIDFLDNTFARVGFLQIRDTSGINLKTELVSTGLTITGTDSGNADSLIIEGDPDGYVKLYNNGTNTVRIASGGFDLSRAGNDNCFIQFYNQNFVTRKAIIQAATTELLIEYEVHGGHIVLQGENTSGTLVDMLRLDSDAGATFKYNNNTRLDTTSTGITITGTTVSLTSTPGTYTPTNVVTDRSYDANATTTAELADVLGSLIADLQTIGLIG